MSAIAQITKTDKKMKIDLYKILKAIVKGKISDAPLPIIQSNRSARKCSSASPWAGNTAGKPSSDGFLDWHSHAYESDTDYYENPDDYSYDD